MLAQTDNPNYKRDTTTGALINNNREELELLRAKRDIELNRSKEIEDLKKQIEELTRLVRER